MSVVPYAFECEKARLIQYDKYTLTIKEDALVLSKEGEDDVVIGGSTDLVPYDALNTMMNVVNDRLTSLETFKDEANFFAPDKKYMLSCMADNGLQTTREININEALETIIYHVKRLLSVDHGVHFDPKSTLFNIPFIENNVLTTREDTLYNALNIAFAYILGHEQIQNSGIAIYLDKVMLKKPLTFTEDGPKATGIAGDGVILTKEYLKKHIDDFVERQDNKGQSFNPFSLIGDLVNAGITGAAYASLQHQINAIWAFLGKDEGLDTLRSTFGGEGGNFPEAVNDFVDNVQDAAEKVTQSGNSISRQGHQLLDENAMELYDLSEGIGEPMSDNYIEEIITQRVNDGWDILREVELPLLRSVEENKETLLDKLTKIVPGFKDILYQSFKIMILNKLKSDGDNLHDLTMIMLAEITRKVDDNKNNAGRTALEIADKADKSYVDTEIAKKLDKGNEMTFDIIHGLTKKRQTGEVILRPDGTEEHVEEEFKDKVNFPDGVSSGSIVYKGEELINTFSHIYNELEQQRTVTNSLIGHTHETFTTVRADDIILNFDLGSKAPLPNPSTSVRDTLNSLDSKCTNIEGHVRNFEAYELPAMLDKKADKTYVDEQIKNVSDMKTIPFITEELK
ncbi:hypothetical protein TVAG_209390 [Trichomonas vaginalis G3]|uniref:Uncharacterized protein n=1 Tax=Trichomonas vaginalis (strain ATCC PRA-98 / G3) TaxID=412133 RepID=A2G2X5_TRIV3|nr:hypothetical protein TVAG_209390 [Trichomonas vaginalis G3]|eukprot:XP_001301418.1 hypothetical protein [Trichomonas vaginalis G3]